MKILLPSFFIVIILVIYSASVQAQVHWKDVASIIYDNCSTCHRPGEIGPFPLMSYQDASNPLHVFSIPPYINSNLMPPWPADPGYSHFIDERILTQNEKDLITAWVNDGALAGDTTLAPDPPLFPTGSQLGVPDLVLTMEQAFTIPGNDSDHYMCFVLPTNLLNAQNISAMEFRPGNASVVHHAFMYVCDDSSAFNFDATTPEYGYPCFGGVGDGVNADFLSLYGPGMTARFYPPGSGVSFPANSFVITQVHYAPLSSEATDQSSINLFFESAPDVRKVYAKKIGEGFITNPPFVIEANEVDTFYSTYPLQNDYSLFAIAPHQHLLGRAYKIFAVTPLEDTIPLISIPQWDFHWQMLYSYPFMLKLPENSIIHAMAVYDNTIYNADNPHNPPEKVKYGESSEDEMFKYFLNMLDYEPGDEDIVLDSSYVATGLPPVAGLVSTPQFYGCSPNPANTETYISYYLPEEITISFLMYDISGKLLQTLPSESSAGFHRIQLDINSYPNGTYFCIMKTHSKNITKEFIIQR
jgi:hypothetical protein